jgi:hypothetical protein
VGALPATRLLLLLEQMAENEDTDVRIVSSGPSFEIWKGPAGAMRLDWTKKGVVRIIVEGHGYAGYAPAMIRRWNDALRVAPKIGVVVHFWDMPTYDSPFRTETQAWGAKHRDALDIVYLLTRSKLVSMGASVLNLALGGIAKVFTKKEEFDIACQKLGLQVNPPMVA